MAIPIDCINDSSILESGAQRQGVGCATVQVDQKLHVADVETLLFNIGVCEQQRC